MMSNTNENGEFPDRWRSDMSDLPPLEAPRVADLQNDPEPAPEPAEPAKVKREKAPKEPTSTRDDFTNACQPLQIKVPQDLIQSLKLHSIATGQTMSELVLDCLTSDGFISKAWVSTRRAG
jgi:hypothetical protein